LLGWTPQYDFPRVLHSVAAGIDPRSELTRLIGSKGYHASPGPS
jgi:UDP-glucose 4-epimerase